MSVRTTFIFGSNPPIGTTCSCGIARKTGVGFEPMSLGVAARRLASWLPGRVVGVEGFEPPQPEGAAFTARSGSPTPAHTHGGTEAAGFEPAVVSHTRLATRHDKPL